MNDRLRVRLDQLVPVKQASRALPGLLDVLTRGDARELVLTRRSEPVAVLVTVRRYEELLGEGKD